MDSADAYESHASEFLKVRDQSIIGTRVVEKWAGSFGDGARVIELGCGGGYPITQVLHAANLQLWAVDSSPTLVSRFQIRFPHIPVQCRRVQECNFFDQTYDGAIAIGLMFLLPKSCQQALIEAVAGILNPGGRFLFSAPTETGEWVDVNTGHLCRSLGRAVYEAYFASANLQLANTFMDVGGNHYYELTRAAQACID